jgi:3-oxoacyl-[acyl-carrier-protein] synthase II
LIAGRSGIAKISRFDPSPYASHIAGEVKDFVIDPYLSPKEARRMDLFIHYGIAAGTQALKDSGLDMTRTDAERVGVNIGSGIGGITMIEDTHDAVRAGGPRKISPFFVPGSIINMTSGYLSIMYGLKGPNLASVSACTTANHSIGESARMIVYGDADVMVAGGSEAAVASLTMGGFCAARALSTRNDDPQTATALCSAKEPASSCWKNTSMPKHEAQKFTPN